VNLAAKVQMIGKQMNKLQLRILPGLLNLAVLVPFCAHAEYHYFVTTKGLDCVVQELRWPYWNSSYYNTWLENDWTSSDG
jgi:hypothetical protein